MTVELAEYLLGLDKYIVDDHEIVRTFFMNIEYPMNFRLTLSAPDDLDQILMIDIKEATKNLLKLACTIKTTAHNTDY